MYVCILCMSVMHVRCACKLSMFWMCVLHVCMYVMYAMSRYVCMMCMYVVHVCSYVCYVLRACILCMYVMYDCMYVCMCVLEHNGF